MKNLIGRHTFCRKLCILLALIFCFYGVIDVDTVQADSTKGLTKLKEEVIYSQYDVTGDGKKDTFFFNNYVAGNVEIHLNGKHIQDLFVAKGGWFYLWKHDSNRVYLILLFGQFGGNSLSVYTYNSAKNQFDCIADSVISETTLACSDVKSIKNNILRVESYFYPSGRSVTSFAKVEEYNTSSLPHFITKYKFYGNKLKPVSRFASTTGKKTYTAVNSFDTKANKKLTGKGPSVKAGTKVTLLGIYFPPQNGTTHKGEVFKIRVGNKIGWFENSNMRLLK